MGERYSKLFSLPEKLYAEGSPLCIEAGALLRDNNTMRVLAQLKLKNLSAETVKAVLVRICALDTAGRPLGEPVDYRYLDLSAARDDEFGSKQPVYLPDAETRSFTVTVTEVVYADNRVAALPDAVWEPLPAPKTLEEALGDAELVKQYKIHYGEKCRYQTERVKDLVRCSCGAWNRAGETACHTCGCGFTPDLAKLTADKDARLAQEAAEKAAAEAKAAEEKAIAEEKAKKARKVAAIVLPILAVVIAAIVVVTKVILPGNAYKNAAALYDAGKYEEAADAFEALGDYKDSAAQIKACEDAIAEAERAAKEAADKADYEEAEALFEAGDYEAAQAAFEALGDYEDSAEQAELSGNKAAYAEAEQLLKDGDKAHAAMAFYALGDFEDAKERSFALWDGNSISAGSEYTVGLKTNGTVTAIGNNDYGQCAFAELTEETLAAILSGNEYLVYGAPWTDIVSVSAGYYHAVGLKADGTTSALGNNDYGQCDVDDLTDIVAVAAGGFHTVGLKSDGTVVAVGNNDYDQCEVSDWTDIVAIAAGQTHTVGLKSDGTVVAVGSDKYGQCEVSDWTDIVAIAAGQAYTVGLKSDGTVVAVGSDKYGQCRVSDWTDIVAVAAGNFHTVGLKSDGTVVAVGYNDNGGCDVSDWTDIVAIAAGENHTVGLKADGTVVAVGYNMYGECDVSDWTDIRLPN